MNWLNRLWNSFDSIFLGEMFALLRANRLLARSIAELDQAGIGGDNPLLALPRETLKNFLETDLGRIARVEDRARSNLGGIATSTAIVGLAVGFYTRDNLFTPECTTLRLLAGICVALSLVCFLLSSIFAVRVYGVTAIARPEMEDHLPSIQDGEFARILLQCINRNRLTATIKGNNFSVSTRFIQNGTILIGSWGILALVAAIG
jgi:hypothetical protein